MDQYGVCITADGPICCGEERTVRESVAVDSSSAFTVFATLSSTVSRSVLMIVIHIYFITSGLL